MPIRTALGVPDDEPFELDGPDIAAMTIIFSEFEGNEFDIDAMRFKERK